MVNFNLYHYYPGGGVGVSGLVGVKSRNNASVELNLLTETGTVLGNSLLQKISLFLKHITW